MSIFLSADAMVKILIWVKITIVKVMEPHSKIILTLSFLVLVDALLGCSLSIKSMGNLKDWFSTLAC